jgi:hypothetical protein
VGLTSPGNREFVEGLDVYDTVHLYDDVSQLPGERAVYVDISGDGAVRTDVHARYGNRLAHSAAVGMTHWTQMAQGASELHGPSPVFFFAPDRIKKRGVDWGTAKLDQNVADAWPRSRSGLRIGFASSASRVRRASSGPTSSFSTERSTRRSAPSWISSASVIRRIEARLWQRSAGP